MNAASLRNLIVLCLVLLTAACQSNSSGTNRSGGSSRASSSTARNTDARLDAKAEKHRIENCRVISYDPRTGATIILVNAGHAWRRSEQGQLNITNGRREVTYKVLSDLQMDSLMETLLQRGSRQIEEPWNDRHARLLAYEPVSGDAFTGIIVVENVGRRKSHIGRRGMGSSYKAFADMRSAILVWERAGITEQVGAAKLGTSDPNELRVPEKPSR